MASQRNTFSRRYLYSIRTKRGWSQAELAHQARLPRSVVSMHCNGTRLIRRNHLANYLRLLSPEERRELLTAWLRDSVDNHLVPDLGLPAFDKPYGNSVKVTDSAYMPRRPKMIKTSVSLSQAH